MESVHNHQKKSTLFLPKLCSRSTSIKDVHLPKLHHISSSSSSSFSSSSDDPSSPRVTCIGQIKRNTTFPNHHKFISTTAAARATDVACHRRKAKVNGLLGRSIANSTTTIRKGPMDVCRSTKSLRGYNGHFAQPADQVNIAEMDPPLPVVKRVKQLGCKREEVNLWMRRSGFTLNSLELHHIYVPENCCIQRTNTL